MHVLLCLKVNLVNSSGTGAVSSSECRSMCPAGTFGSFGLAPCNPCKPSAICDKSALSSRTHCHIAVLRKLSMFVLLTVESGPVGSFADAAGSTSCSPCNSGTSTSSSGATSSTACLPICPAGSSGPVQPCTQCPKGTYSTQPASSVCTPCSNGTSTPNVGSTSSSDCQLCAAGYFGTQGRLPCTACAKGSFTVSAGLAACTPCGSGQSTQAEGSMACANICPPGSFGLGGVVPWCVPPTPSP